MFTLNNCLNQKAYNILYNMINKNISGFTISPEIRKRISQELSSTRQGRKVLEILKKGSEQLTTKQQETIMSYLSQYAIDATSLLIGGKLRGDIAKTIIDVIGNRMFTTMVTNYRSEYKTRANAEMITGQIKIFQTTIGIPINGKFKTIPHGHHVRSIINYTILEKMPTQKEHTL